MPTQMLVYFVTKEEYQAHLRTGLPYKRTFAPYFQLSQTVEFDIYSGVYRIFHNSGSGYFKPLSEHDITTTGNINEYFEKGEEFYVTSNGVRFYRVLDIHVGIQKLLELSLQLIANDIYVESNHAFMIMPFRNKNLNTFYKQNIKTYLNDELGINIFRADDFNDNNVIVDTIYREIEKAEFIICEVSECNKNVFFEIGYSKALKKRIDFYTSKGRGS